MTYTAQNVAHYTVSYCTSKSSPVSNLKLQKLLYFLWVDYYRATSQSLFYDDICAWKLGPVVPDVYYEFSSYAGMPISLTPFNSIDAADAPVLNRIIDRYLPETASTLVNRTHQKGTPWDQIYRDGLGNREVIPYELIKAVECGNHAH